MIFIFLNMNYHLLSKNILVITNNSELINFIILKNDKFIIKKKKY